MIKLSPDFRYLKALGKARDVDGFSNKLAALLADYDTEELIKSLGTQKVVSSFRDAQLIDRVLAETIRKLIKPLSIERLCSLKSHFDVCALVQQVFAHLDAQAITIPSLHSEPRIFRLAVLRRVEERRLEAERTAAAVDSDKVGPQQTGNVMGVFHQNMADICEAANTLISANNKSASPAPPPLIESEIDALMELAAHRNSILEQFDMYSYGRIKAHVNRRSIVFGNPWNNELGLASLWASQRRESDDMIGRLPYQQRRKQFAVHSREFQAPGSGDFEAYFHHPHTQHLLKEALLVIEPLYQNAVGEVEKYFELDEQLTLPSGCFTFQQLLKAWQCLVAVAEIAALWIDLRPELNATDVIPVLPSHLLSALIRDQAAMTIEASQLLLEHFTAEQSHRVDLFFKPLVSLPGDTLAIPVAFIRMSRIGRNVLTIAVRETNFNQKDKGGKALVALRQLFLDAAFQAIIDFQVDSNGRNVSDIDLAAFKDGVLFVGQSKIVIHPDSVYETWSVREKLTTAAHQMSACIDALPTKQDTLLKRLGASGDSVTVVPFLITNAWQFTGTRVMGYSVVDYSYLSMLLRGAEISVLRVDDEQIDVARRKLVVSKYPTGSELKTLIEDPLHRTMFEKPTMQKLRLLKIGATKIHIPFRQVWVDLKP